uniref:CYP750C30 n=1 Tax=Taxus chinensis TaxID=29808 RepID=A0A291FB07_TAXCH|nr:CYP750C30 [Taxus chinensis]
MEAALAFNMVLSRLVEAYASAVATAFTILVFFYVFFCSFTRNAKLPPGPFSWPIIGNLHQLGNLPHRSLQVLSKKYGPVMYLRLGSFPTVVVSSAEMAKEFLQTHDLAFASRPPSAAGKYLTYNYKDITFVPYGAYIRHARKLCVTELLSAKRLESFRFIREEEVSLAIRSIWEKSREGRVAVNIGKAIASLTSAIVWRILVGARYSDDDDGDLVGKEFRDMVLEIAGSIHEVNIGDFIPYIDWLDMQGIKKRMKKANRSFDRVMQRLLEEHVKFKGTHNSKVKDFMDVLLEMAETDTMNIGEENIKAIILVLSVGGIDTTSTSVEWAMSELLRNPHVAKKLQQEIESVVGKNGTVTESDLGSMEYLQCVVKESLRLYPPGPMLFPHESTKACTVGADRFVFPGKTRLMVNVWAIGRDPAVWDDPLAFRPERFMGKDIDIKGREFSMLPFGAGRRGCPGASMATRSMELMLAHLMHCFDWSVDG